MFRKPAFAAEFYTELNRNLHDVRRAVEQRVPYQTLPPPSGGQFHGASAEFVEVFEHVVEETYTGWRGIREIRDLARWCGATHVGSTRAGALRMFILRWLGAWDLQVASLRNRGFLRRVKRDRMRRRAYEAGIPFRQFVAQVRADEARSRAVARARFDTRHSWRVIAKRAKMRGNVFIAKKSYKVRALAV